jgi:hypothetical protein
MASDGECSEVLASEAKMHLEKIRRAAAQAATSSRL